MSDFPREKCLILFQFPCLHLLWSEIFILQVIEILYYFLTKKKKKKMSDLRMSPGKMSDFIFFFFLISLLCFYFCHKNERFGF